MASFVDRIKDGAGKVADVIPDAGDVDLPDLPGLADAIRRSDGEIVVRLDGDNEVTTGNQDDLIITGGGDDIIDAGDGDDVVITGDGDDVIDAGPGNDQDIQSGRGRDVAGGLDHGLDASLRDDLEIDVRGRS